MAETGYTLPQLALLYLLDDPRVTCVIPGSANVAELEANLAVATLPRLPVDIDQSASHRRSAIPVPQRQGHDARAGVAPAARRSSLHSWLPDLSPACATEPLATDYWPLWSGEDVAGQCAEVVVAAHD